MKPNFNDKYCTGQCPYRYFVILSESSFKPESYVCKRYKQPLKKRLVKGRYRVYKCTECTYEL